MTNRDMFTAIINGDITEEVIAKVKEEIEKLDARNAKRRETVSKKALENAPIVEAIKSVLSDTPQTASEIAEKVEISTQKASALLKQIDGLTVSDVKVKGKGTRKAYALAQLKEKNRQMSVLFIRKFFRTCYVRNLFDTGYKFCYTTIVKGRATLVILATL